MKKTMLSLMMLAVLGVAAEDIVFTPEQVVPVKYGKTSVREGIIHLKSSSAEWNSGVKIIPGKDKKFDFSNARFLAVDVKNLSPDRQIRLTMHISSGKRKEKSTSHVDLPHREINTGIALNPGEKRTMRLYLPHAKYFTAPDGGKNFKPALDTAHINAVEFKMQWPFEEKRKDLINCELSHPRLEGEPDYRRAVPAERYFPFVDRYGQYKHTEWPEKIRNDEDLKKEHQKEIANLKPAPAEWNRYGGWKNGPAQKATGAFRVGKQDGKWFLIDPEGKLFWSFGIDVLRNQTDAADGKKHPEWFEAAPGERGTLPFNHWNLQKKYGKNDYQFDFYKMLVKRLKSWGVNTVGNWAANEMMLLGETPYVLSLGEMIGGIPRLGKVKFYDVFSPEFEQKMSGLLKTLAERKEIVRKSIDDPMCIGYFIDNELRFGDIMSGVFSQTPDRPAKKKYLEHLENRFGDIDTLNRAWKTNYPDWKSLAQTTRVPAEKEVRADFKLFEREFVRKYFETCRKGIKSAAPHRLYLGCRFVGFRQREAVGNAAAEFCDVVSVNTYSASVFNVKEKLFGEKPILIGEFHFGTYDRGMFSASLCPTGDQNERAVSLTRFLQGALAHPDFIGAHYFQFRDQPLTGRFDGEGYQIGFTDTADTPYQELIDAARTVGETMYRFRLDGKFPEPMK